MLKLKLTQLISSFGIIYSVLKGFILYAKQELNVNVNEFLYLLLTLSLTYLYIHNIV